MLLLQRQQTAEQNEQVTGLLFELVNVLIEDLKTPRFVRTDSWISDDKRRGGAGNPLNFMGWLSGVLFHSTFGSNPYAIVVLSINTGGFMPRTTSITIGDQLDAFVSRMIDDGRYGSTSEVVRSALRLLEQKESQMELLRRAIIAGEESGENPMTLREIAAQKKRARNV